MALKPEDKKKNEQIIEQLALNFFPEKKNKYLLVFDFDELLTIEHTASLVTHHFASKEERQKIIKKYGDYTFEAMLALSDIKKGTTKTEYRKIVLDVCKNIHWRSEALDLIKFYQGKPGFQVMILSAGAYWLEKTLLDDINLSVPLLATEFQFEKEIITGTKHVVTDELKGRIIEIFKEKHCFEKIFVIGHSRGDIFMLSKGIGIAFRPTQASVKKAAKYTVKEFREIPKIIGQELFNSVKR